MHTHSFTQFPLRKPHRTVSPQSCLGCGELRASQNFRSRLSTVARGTQEEGHSGFQPQTDADPVPPTHQKGIMSPDPA